MIIRQIYHRRSKIILLPKPRKFRESMDVGSKCVIISPTDPIKNDGSSSASRTETLEMADNTRRKPSYAQISATQIKSNQNQKNLERKFTPKQAENCYIYRGFGLCRTYLCKWCMSARSRIFTCVNFLYMSRSRT